MTTVNIKQLGNTVPEHYSVGQYFLIKESVFILAQVGVSEVNLIGLDCANRLTDPYIKVADVYHISQEEFRQLFIHDFDYQLLSSVDIGWKL